jgi:hypothetical protein
MPWAKILCRRAFWTRAWGSLCRGSGRRAKAGSPLGEPVDGNRHHSACVGCLNLYSGYGWASPVGQGIRKPLLRRWPVRRGNLWWLGGSTMCMRIPCTGKAWVTIGKMSVIGACTVVAVWKAEVWFGSGTACCPGGNFWSATE